MGIAMINPRECWVTSWIPVNSSLFSHSVYRCPVVFRVAYSIRRTQRSTATFDCGTQLSTNHMRGIVKSGKSL